MTYVKRTEALETRKVGGPVLVLNYIFPSRCRRVIRGRVHTTICARRVTGKVTRTTMESKGATFLRVGVSAKVKQVKFGMSGRDIRAVSEVDGLPGVGVRKVFARFTGTSRFSGSCAFTRRRGFL